MQSIPDLEKPASMPRSQSAATAEEQPPNLGGTLPTRAGKRQGGTVRQDDSIPQKCFVCGGKAEASGWFCQMPGEDKRIVLCSPCCALSYFNLVSTAPGTNGQENLRYEDGVHFVLNGE